MYAAQKIRHAQMLLDSKMTSIIPHIEDEFNKLFYWEDNLKMFLRLSLRRKDIYLMQFFIVYNRQGVPFSTLYADEAVETNLKTFIKRVSKMEKYVDSRRFVTQVISKAIKYDLTKWYDRLKNS